MKYSQPPSVTSRIPRDSCDLSLINSAPLPYRHTNYISELSEVQLRNDLLRNNITVSENTETDHCARHMRSCLRVGSRCTQTSEEDNNSKMLASMAALNTMFLLFQQGLLFWTTLCNYQQYQKLIQQCSRRSDNEYILLKIAAAASHTAGFRSVHLPAKLRHRMGARIAQDMLVFSHKHFTRQCSVMQDWSQVTNSHLTDSHLTDTDQFSLI